MITPKETKIRKKLIEVALPLEAINSESAREKSIRHGHPSTLHLWWARRPLAAARAILFAQLVDDPSSWPEEFPNEEAQEKERQRLFRLIEQFVKWENSNNAPIINAARLEIARSHARASKSAKAKKILRKEVAPEVVNEYLATELPPVHDPFAGGGTIPLEAQRLGLRAIASDLNPVAVLINKALIEIPPKFADRPPVNPEARAGNVAGSWAGARGLAEDVRYYGAWMREEARRRIGHLYPEVDLPKENGGKAPVIAWLWARTVPSPDPAFGGVHVPLVSSFWLSTKKGKETWLDPVVDGEKKIWRFDVVTGKTTKSDAERKRIGEGTKRGRSEFQCILSGSPIPASHVREMGQTGKMGARLLAIVAESNRARIYLPATEDAETVAVSAESEWSPDFEFAKNSRHMTPWGYGLNTFAKLFTQRQLVTLTTFADLVAEARGRAVADAVAAGAPSGTPLREGGCDAEAYGDAVATYIGLSVGKAADYNSALVTWSCTRDQAKTTFTRQALPMVWDFTEVNPFAAAAGDLQVSIQGVCRTLAGLPTGLSGIARQADARSGFEALGAEVVTSTDPPYFDNVPYADLSDFFYVWLRRSIGRCEPTLFSTILVPKEDELIAEPTRHGGRERAEEYFLQGMTEAMSAVAGRLSLDNVVTIYYAFKQTEIDEGEASVSTGWETFLDAVLSTNLSIEGTWPIRSERGVRTRSLGSNALASSIVLVCRRRSPSAQPATRSDFRRLLKRELPEALRHLQAGNIAPVDLPQAAIGPGMAVFSRHPRVLEPDGSIMTVRMALQLINEALDEYLTEQEGDFDPYTRFGLTWYEQHRWENGPFGDAENVAKARNIAVAGVAEAGFLVANAGKVRLLRRTELPKDWDPLRDTRATIWEATQHLIKRLETDGGEKAAAELLARLGPHAQPARDLAYRLYTLCERKKWADDALSYNSLVVAWPDLQRLAEERPTPKQQDLL